MCIIASRCVHVSVMMTGTRHAERKSRGPPPQSREKPMDDGCTILTDDVMGTSPRGTANC